ncbi:MAG: hypothetical protein E7570_07415 [Ruminococcaceae bacterium]|nr:hypothetical protein [Oscillospiraceae bacterium]
MKKVLAIIICLAIAVCAFTACSSKKPDKEKTTEKTTASSQMTTDTAVIKEADAINLIESYSDKELGLSAKDRKKASFMVAGEGVKIDGENYIEVVATVKKEHKDGDNTTYTFDHLGMYYIRYDGKKILKKDMKSKEDKYSEMKVKAVPSTTTADVTTKE